MRIIYMGTPEFAVPSLEILLENGCNVVAVVTAPDKPAGRGLKLQPSAVKCCATTHNVPVLQPTNLKDPAFLDTLRSYRADLQIVVAFRMLPEAVWNMPPKGTFNLHASLLPQYRGAAPINWAIINGETTTGVTTFFLKHEIDTGDLLFQEEEPIYPTDTAGTLYERLMQRGANLVLKTVQHIAENRAQPFPQVVSETPKRAPKIFKEDCEINFSQTPKQVHNFVRGLAPYPTAWLYVQGKRCKVFEVAPQRMPPAGAPLEAPLGSLFVEDKKGLFVRVAEGWVSLLNLQLEGRKPMRIEEFLRGFVL